MRRTGIALVLLLGIMLISGLACGSGEWRLLTYTEGQGTISPSTGTFPDGEVVTLTAIPESGWDFDHWGVQASGSVNPIEIIMDSDKTVSAYFVEITPLAGFQEYTDTQHGFSIAFPNNWFVDPKETEEGIYVFAGGISLCSEDYVTTGVASFINDPPWSLEKCNNHYIDTVIMEKKGYNIISTENLIIGDLPAIKTIYTNTEQDYIEQHAEVFLVDEYEHWLISISLHSECWDFHIDDLNTIIGSFRLLE